MSDPADFANELLLKSMDLALAARKRAKANAASMFCIEAGCGTLIPWQRRYAVANCVRCMTCQMKLERQGVGHAG